jgi:hypothetical protein
LDLAKREAAQELSECENRLRASDAKRYEAEELAHTLRAEMQQVRLDAEQRVAELQRAHTATLHAAEAAHDERMRQAKSAREEALERADRLAAQLALSDRTSRAQTEEAAESLRREREWRSRAEERLADLTSRAATLEHKNAALADEAEARTRSHQNESRRWDAEKAELVAAAQARESAMVKRIAVLEAQVDKLEKERDERAELEARRRKDLETGLANLLRSSLA